MGSPGAGLPFDQGGYGGLPELPVVQALAYCDAQGITDTTIRQINVLGWVLSHLAYRGQVESELYRQVYAAFHALLSGEEPSPSQGAQVPSDEAATPETIAEAEIALAAWVAAHPQPRRCGACGSASFWTTPWGEVLCQQCHPDPRALPGTEGG